MPKSTTKTPKVSKTLRRSRKAGYPELTDKMIAEFVGITKQISESIAKDQTREMILDPKVINTLRYVERYVAKNDLVVYGGTALNAVLPPKDQFYSKEYDLPDWDFFSADPIRDAITIADDVHKKTGSETFVTTAAHHGTYKVYADGVSIADITHVDPELLDVLRKHALKRDDILYSGPDYLRMAAYMELSRPRGQVERWEKVIRRISYMNRAHPIHIRDYKPVRTEVSKSVRNSVLRDLVSLQLNKGKHDDEFAFFGPECVDLVRRTVGRDKRKSSPEFSMPRFGLFPMLMTPSPKKTVKRIVQSFNKNTNIIGEESPTLAVEITRKGRGEFLPQFHEVRLGKTGPVLCLVLGTSNGCQSVYRIPSKVTVGDDGKKQTQEIMIASVESCIYLYMSIRFAKVLPIPASALLKVCDSLVRYHYKAFASKKEPILPLPTECIGSQETLYDMRKSRQTALKKMSTSRGWKNSADYYLWNIKYNGGDESLRNTILRALKKHDTSPPVKSKRKTIRRRRR